MARESTESVAESDEEKPKPSASKKNASQEDVEMDGGPEEEQDEEEEEYEVEAILDAKRGAVTKGEWGYFVKWRGYGDEHNSWIDQKDANAEELITEFWRKSGKDKRAAPRKSLDSKAQKPSTSKAARKSVAREASSDAEPESISMVKKRSRASTSGKTAKQKLEENEDEDRQTEKRIAKKPRTSTGSKRAPSLNGNEDEDMNDLQVGNMEKWMNVANWEPLIGTIDTVERDEANDVLMVYFRLKGTGERVKEDSELCKERFPRKLIDFYESHLKWKTTQLEPEEP